MRKIRILLEYRCYPIWVYNEKGEIVLNDVPNELKNEIDIQNLLTDIQDKYDSLFIDNKVEFRYKEFDNEVEKKKFISKISKVVQLIESKVGNTYKIENSIHF